MSSSRLYIAPFDCVDIDKIYKNTSVGNTVVTTCKTDGHIWKKVANVYFRLQHDVSMFKNTCTVSRPRYFGLYFCCLFNFPFKIPRI